MKKILLSYSCLALALVCSAPLALAKEGKSKTESAKKRQHKKGKAPTPSSLVADMRKAVAYIAVQAQKDLNAKSKQERPFWAGLKLASESLDQMEKGIKAKDGLMVEGLDGVGKGVEMIGTAWGMLRAGEKDSKVGRGVLGLYEAYHFFETHFGPAAARYKKGGAVSGDEKALYVKAQKEQKKLQASLLKLQTKAGENPLQARLVADLLRQLAGLADLSSDSLDHYCSYMYHWGRFETTFYAYNDCIEVWYPEFYINWKTIYVDYAVVSSLFTTTEQWSSYSGWDYTMDSVASYGDYYESAVSVETSELSQSETLVESYVETSATEEVASESAELLESYNEGPEEGESFADEAMDHSDDADGDGVANDDDLDDDNDGTPDRADTDDDGDGVSDEADTDMDELAGEDNGDSDDDGIADVNDSDDDNDGTMDSVDADDDGDGVDDSADSDDQGGGDSDGGGGGDDGGGGGDDGGGGEE